jgi:hypothetical protein
MKFVGSLFGIKAPDTSAQEAQIAEQRRQIEEDRALAQAETRDEAEKRAARLAARMKGGKRMLLAERDDAEMGVKAKTLGGGTP